MIHGGTAARLITPLVLFGLVAVTLALVTAARVYDYKETFEPTGDPVSSCQLRFEDMPSGVVVVYDSVDGRPLAQFERGSGSFVRGVLRSMTREHKSTSPAPDAVFRLAKFSDGALTIRDETTGRQIYLNAFGPTNMGVFDRLLTASQSES